MRKLKFKNGVRAVKGSPVLWDINYQVNGVRTAVRLPFGSYDEALAWRLVQKSALRNRKEVAVGGEPVVDLHEALKLIQKRIKNKIDLGKLCKTSLSEVIPPYKRFFFDYPKSLGKVWITTADPTPDDLKEYENYYGNVLNRKAGVSTEFRKVKNIFYHFYEQKIMSLNRLSEFRAVESPSKNVRPFIGNPDSDFTKVLLLIKDKKPRLFEFLSFLASTGRRPREVRHYRREYVDLERGYINIPSKTKDGEPSKILLDGDLRKIVVKAMEFSRKLNSEWLFVNDHGRQFSANNPQIKFQEAAKACKIPNWEKWCVYQLKKRFITVCRSAGKSAEAISQVTGHKDLDAVLKNYSFPDKDQSDQVLKVGRLKV
jgi:integrase